MNIKKILEFSFDKRGFVVTFIDTNDIKKQYGSTSRHEMAEFAAILAERLKPDEGIVAKTQD